jgi:rubrerythrin
MAVLKGSKTEEHLKAAFAGEAQANRRYLYFSQKADVEGFQRRLGGIPLDRRG